eukprot:Skav224590  [mRNA]  locus=scaffold2684:133988:142555:- [translate_table: standard]
MALPATCPLDGYSGSAFSSSCSSELTNLSTEAPSELPKPALRGVLYGAERPLCATAARVTWDEECIAEHDKERGTRQKIDEPDTPFVRSPTGSDDEAEEKPLEPPAVAKSRPRVQLEAGGQALAAALRHVVGKWLANGCE